MNSCIIIGRLGKDVELRYTENQKAVANFSVATSEWSKEKEITTWHNVVVWEKRAENCAKYLAKGSQVGVQGRIQNRSYTDKEGIKRFVTEIVAHDVEFLSSQKDSEKKTEARQFEPSGGNETKASNDPFNEEDLPF